MKLRLNADVCVGHGRCYELAPDLFGDDERGHCVLRAEQVPKALERDALRGAANCPEGAIEIEYVDR